MLRTLDVVLFSVISVSVRVAATRQAPDLCHRHSQNDCPRPEKRILVKKTVHLCYYSPRQKIRVTRKITFILDTYALPLQFFHNPQKRVSSNFNILAWYSANCLIRISTAQPTVLSGVSAIFSLRTGKQRHSLDFLPSYYVILRSLSYSKRR
jgi:uncharacterized protein YceK